MAPVNVLMLVDYYLPGYKGGGPIRTLVNMVDQLGDDFCLKLVSRDRDLGDAAPYRGIMAEHWYRVGQADVQYLSLQGLPPWGIGNLLRETPHDVLYLNSFFSPVFTITPLVLRRFRLIPATPVIVAPRGELASGAIAIKSWKKRLYMAFVRWLGLHRGLVWQASSPREEADIRRWFGRSVQVVVAPDVRARPALEAHLTARPAKLPGRLKVVFLSRIVRMKNLAGALKLLRQSQGEIEFNIYGPREDEEYWRECEAIMCTLPAGVRVHYRGVARHEQVAAILAEHELFFLPTYGENFGHAILEALVAGCPVLISDQTPWQGLQELGVGWNLPLDKPELFKEALQQCVDADDRTLGRWSELAKAYGQRCGSDEQVVEQTRHLFRMSVKQELQKGGTT